MKFANYWFEQALAVTLMAMVTLVNCDLEMYYGKPDLFDLMVEEFFPDSESSNGDAERFTGIVGANNYSYYTYESPDAIQIRLISLEGDVDLYIGENELRPTFELNKHSLQSTTCGDDVIVVESAASMKRPIGIGVYGHPSHYQSTYELIVTRLPPAPKEQSNGYLEDELDATESKETSSNDQKKSNHNSSNKNSDGESSVAWEIILAILGGLLKIIFEVLT